MKKTAILISTVLFSSFLMVSCKKEYTCTCTLTVAGVTQTTTSNLGKTTKGKAQDACEEVERAANTGGAGMGVSASCSLD